MLDPIESRPSPDASTEEAIFGTFFIGDREFALPANRVREVVPYPDEVTPLPRTDAAVRGICGLRGELLPIVDASALLGLESAEASRDLRVAVISAAAGHLGVAFDRTGEVVRIAPGELAPLTVAEDGGRRVVDGVITLGRAGRFIPLLSMDLLAGIPGLVHGAAPRTDAAGAALKVYRKWIVARVGEHELAFPIESVLEIQEQSTDWRSDAAYGSSSGIVEHRGELRTVMDFRRLLGLPPLEGPGKVVFLAHETTSVGLEVDALVETYECAADDLMPVETPGTRLGQFSCGVLAAGGQRHLIAIDVATIAEQYGFERTEAAEDADDDHSADSRGVESFFAFRVGATMLGIELDRVSEVCTLPDGVTMVEAHRGRSSGMMSLRGDVIPVVDIRPASDDVPAEAAVVLVDRGARRFGLVVDRVESIVRGEANRVSTAQMTGQGSSERADLANLAPSAVLVQDGKGESTMLLLLDPNLILGEETAVDAT